MRFLLAAAVCLGVLGAAGARADDPSLVRLSEALEPSRDARERRYAAWSLSLAEGQLPEAVVHRLLGALDDPDVVVRRHACHALLNVDDTIGLLTRRIASTEVRPRGALACLPETGPTSARPLVGLLDGDLTPDRRVAVLRTLGEMGPDAADAAGALAQLLASSRNRLERHHAATALGNIGQPALSHVTPLAADGISDEYVARTLQLIGPDAASMTDVLLASLDTARDWRLQAAIVSALGSVANDTAPVAQRLGQLVGSDAHPAVRSGAADALGGFTGLGETVVPVLAARTEAAEPRVSQVAARALARHAPTGIAILVEFTRHDNAQVRRLSVQALGTADEATPALTAALIQALDDDDRAVREAAGVSLPAHGTGSVPAVVAAATDRKNDRVRHYALRLLGEYVPVPPEGLQPLRSALDSTDVMDQQLATWSLGRYGPRGADAAPRLQELLASSDATVRKNAAWALGNIGSAAEPARQALKNAQRNDPDAAVRDQAEEALQKLDGTYTGSITHPEDER